MPPAPDPLRFLILAAASLFLLLVWRLSIRLNKRKGKKQ